MSFGAAAADRTVRPDPATSASTAPSTDSRKRIHAPYDPKRAEKGLMDELKEHSALRHHTIKSHTDFMRFENHSFGRAPFSFEHFNQGEL